MARWSPTFLFVLQVTVSVTSVYLLTHASAAGQRVWPWLLTAVAIAFNPIVTVPWGIDAWRLACLGAAAVLIGWLSLVHGWSDRLGPWGHGAGRQASRRHRRRR